MFRVVLSHLFHTVVDEGLESRSSELLGRVLGESVFEHRQRNVFCPQRKDHDADILNLLEDVCALNKGLTIITCLVNAPLEGHGDRECYQ